MGLISRWSRNVAGVLGLPYLKIEKFKFIFDFSNSLFSISNSQTFNFQIIDLYIFSLRLSNSQIIQFHISISLSFQKSIFKFRLFKFAISKFQKVRYTYIPKKSKFQILRHENNMFKGVPIFSCIV